MVHALEIKPVFKVWLNQEGSLTLITLLVSKPITSFIKQTCIQNPNQTVTQQTSIQALFSDILNNTFLLSPYCAQIQKIEWIKQQNLGTHRGHISVCKTANT